MDEKIAAFRQKIEEHAGLYTTQVWEVRDAAGYDRLGTYAVSVIPRKLAKDGLIGILGLNEQGELPLDRNATVRVYLKGPGVGDLIDAVLDPTPSGDNLLREAGNDDATQALEHIRMLVCR